MSGLKRRKADEIEELIANSLYFDIWESNLGEIKATYVQGGLDGPRNQPDGYDFHVVRMPARSAEEATEYVRGIVKLSQG
ncbi:hypothetical protein [Dongshaea marina]|uniref:hypothetical protein n=1 Tax=Dongshaea marina TaxID=2047966 RepID=UPI000D3E4B8A|nr:hypothetical protein [Dongshaea marina]